MTDIVSLLEKREEIALQHLKEQYGNYCYTVLYGILRDHGEVEEAMNDVWLRIWKSIPPEKPRCFKAYVAKISRNIALDRVKYQNAQKRKATTLPIEEIGEMLPTLTWEQQEEEGQIRELLNNYVKSLKLEERRIFLRRYWYNDTIEELAEAFHCSPSRITGILFRVRKRLRKYLEKEGYSYE